MEIVNFPYRWIPRTIFPNLKSAADDIIHGIHNIFVWVPIIWHDADWDWDGLAKVMEFKMRRMSKLHKEHPIVSDSHRMSRQLLICAELLKRLREDTLDYQRVKLHDGKMRHYNRYLGELIGKHLRTWWN